MRHKASTKLMKIALLALLIVSLITACSNSNSADSGSNRKEDSGNANGSGSDEVIKLRMIESLTSPKRTELLNAMLKQFQDENPNIKVELISPPFDQADNKIRTMLGAKQELDIVEARDLNVAEFVNNGFLEPLTDYTANWSDFATMTSAAKSTATVGDKLYFIPNGLYQRQMFYRADWLKEKGIEVPATYVDLVSASVALTDSKSNRYGFSFRGGPGANAVPDTMIQAYNAEKVDLNDAMFLKDGGTIYSSPEAKAAVDLYLKLYKEGSPPDSVNWGFQEQVQAFTSGVTAFLLQDPDVIQVLQENMDEGTWSTAPMPTGPSGKALISAGGAGWGITSYSKHKDAAWKLIAFLSSPAQNTQFSKDYGTVPIHSSAAEDEFFKTGPYKTLLDMTNMPDTFLNFKPPFEYPANGQWGTVSMETGQAMLLGQATAQDTLKKWDEYWKKAKEEKNK
ncbi:ABC transporter substrate-binding protein [Paenibacillus thermotolerans]|uniref:ABC transporter substrate-binding protein n=1 Tax=Paenibacillus thermotolerans TaxID=3027807 RepID=UPI0023683332|nr:MULTISPECIES: sugar ABC transporter substrate-binding protein [unclassified Paenibacillus]